MRILVTGAGGQVGSELVSLGRLLGNEVTGLTRPDLDITDREGVNEAIIRHQPDLLINAAAYTAVDKAESEQSLAGMINVEGARNIAIACAELDCWLIHFSTDYVFDGRQEAPYDERADVSPLGVYGTTKELGERLIREHAPRHIIIRTSWVFGATGHNFVKTILRLANERDELAIVDDQTGGPTEARDIATAALKISDHIESGKIQAGTYNFSGAPAVTWYGFTNAILDRAGSLIGEPPVVHPITTEDYPVPAPRPKHVVFDCNKIRQAFGIEQPDWRISLARVLGEIADQRSENE